jgi:hypothetical protein
MTSLDYLLVGGRVIDPESGLDTVANVGVANGAVAYIGSEQPPSTRSRHVEGLVVAPGFIDLHSHVQSTTGQRVQALDGVTTALELEAGAAQVRELTKLHAAEGRPINFGFSASWHVLRSVILAGETLRPEPGLQREFNTARGRMTPVQVSSLMNLLERELADGALGIGVPLGYIPETGSTEYLRIAEMAAEWNLPVFTHARYISELEPRDSVEAALEIIGVAAASGARMHYCHLNSTSLRRLPTITKAIQRARQEGIDVTTEAYPYGSGSTHLSAYFLDPELLPRLGIEPTAIRVLATGERISSLDRLQQLRDSDPSGMCVVDYFREEDESDVSLLVHALTFDDTAIASDAVPLEDSEGQLVESQWPLAADVRTHPRTAGTFSKVLRWVVRERRLLTLQEAIRRMTIIPARVLSGVPAMAKKGRVQVGSDADIVVFNPDTVGDRATYDQLLTSVGFKHVMVNGQLVVDDYELLPDINPGHPVLRL